MSQFHDDPTCPCHEFSARTPSEAPTPTQGDAGFLIPEPKNVPDSLLTQNSPIPAPAFEQEWHNAPRWATRTTERESAEYWFIRGQHAKEVELLAGMNLDLREMVRVARERMGR